MGQILGNLNLWINCNYLIGEIKLYLTMIELILYHVNLDKSNEYNNIYFIYTLNNER